MLLLRLVLRSENTLKSETQVSSLRFMAIVLSQNDLDEFCHRVNAVL